MNLRKICAIALSWSMILSSFALPDFAQASDSSVPQSIYVLDEQDFSDGLLDSRWTFDTSGGNAAESDGTLCLTRAQSEGNASAAYYLLSDRSSIAAPVAVEYTLLKSSSDASVAMQMRFSGTSSYFAAEWIDDTLWASYATRRNGSATTSQVADSLGDTIKLSVFFNPASAKYSLYLDGTPLLEDVYACSRGASEIENLYFSLSSDSLSTLEIKSLKTFYWKHDNASDALCTRYDSIWLAGGVITTEEKHPQFGTITKNLNLPTSGPYGSTIEWTSSDENIILPDGTVTRPGAQYDADPEVTLTALITCGDDERTVTYTYKVLRNLSGSADFVDADCAYITESVISSEALDSITQNLTLPTKGPWGSDIKWQSSNDLYVASDGTVTRPSAGEPDASVILEAAVSHGSVRMTKLFVLTVKSMEAPLVSSELAVKNMIVNDDFEDGVLPATLSSKHENRDGISESGGVLTVSRTNAFNSFTYHFDKDYTKYQGIYCVEFDAIKSKPGMHAYIRIMGSEETGEYMRLIWNASGAIGGGLSADSGKKYTSDRIRLKFLVDTANSVMTYWIDDNLEGINKSTYGKNITNISCVKFSIEAHNNTSLSIDNLKVYETEVSDSLKAIYDYKSMYAEKYLTAEPNIVDPMFIKDNLNLPVVGDYGSAIEWTSSNPDLIAADGTVHRPSPDEYSGHPPVALTAKITNGGVTKYRTFVYKVMLKFDDDATVNNDYNLLDYPLFTSEDSSEITMSLNLLREGGYGSTISWSSSDEAVITKSGRVIRPRAGEPDCTVELTAHITCGTASADKTFSVTVLADEEFSDPQHMTDEEFFGVWDSSEEKWTIESKLIYEDFPDLSPVCEAAKAGDYLLAKEELFKYYKNLGIGVSASASGRNSNWANAYAEGFYWSGASSRVHADLHIPSEESEIYANISASTISPGGSEVYNICAWYNEATTLSIASVNHPDESKRPRMELVVNGVVKTYTACGDATLRAGAYVDTNYGFDEYLKVKTYGDFMGDETYRSIIKFDFSDLKSTDKITSARLILTASHDLPGEEKRVGIFTESQIGWDETNVTWSSLYHYFYQYGGLPGGNTWNRPTYSETEYHYQVPRFYSLPVIATEYVVTGDEYYAYKGIRELQDFITDKGGELTKAGDLNTRGLYPRTLDAAGREANTYKALANLINSKYMDAETFTAYMKHVWDIANALYHNPSKDGNWLQSQMTSVLRIAYRFPEFYNSYNGIKWFESARGVLEDFISTNNYEDGSYIEGVDSYASGVCTTMIGFKNTMMELGADVSEEYDEALIKSMYYNAIFVTPFGETVQYGDAGLGNRYNAYRFRAMAKYYGEDELLYIDTFGREGTQPDWTSKVYYGSKEAFLRSSWSTDALYMFTNVHEKGGHNHADDNSVTVAAFGRTLLNDAGVFTYTSTNPMRKWGQSTRAHNTVEINNTTQTGNGSTSGGEYGPGTIDHFVTDNSFDFLSMTTHNNPGFTHTRNTMFSKQNYWIITDYMVPSDASQTNTYKQLWHMRPDAELSSDSTANIIRSNYPSGANLIIASADNDVTVKEELGWWDKSSNEVYESNYGYFEKNQSGITTMATVLVPYKDSNDAQVSAELLDVGVTADKATVMKINSYINRASTTGWYYLSYESAPYATRTFGNYSTDGQLAFVLENDVSGEISTVNFKDASFVKDAQGNVIAALPQKVSSASFDWKGTRLEILTDADISHEGIKAKSFDTTDVTVNGEAVSFSLTDDGYVVVGTSGTSTSISGTETSSKGEIGVRPGSDSSSSAGGSGGGGGSVSGAAVSGGSSGTVSGGLNGFTDTIGHWAESDINYLAGKGIVTGRTLTLFAPEENITRAEFLTLMLRITGTPAKGYGGEFDDVFASDWYAGNISAALELGLISADSSFRPNDPVSREEMIKIAVNAFGLTNDLPEASDLNFTDEAEISPWAKSFVSMGVQLGFVTGMPDGSFAPKSHTTRAQGAVIANRVLSRSGSVL